MNNQEAQIILDYTKEIEKMTKAVLKELGKLQEKNEKEKYPKEGYKGK